MSLSKQYRFSSRKEFKEVLKKGEKIHTPLFTLLVSNDEGVKMSRFGFIVSKKIDKKAVIRNKVRRRLSEAVRLLLPKLRQDVRVIFLVRPVLKDKKTQEIVEVLRQVRGIFGDYAEKKQIKS